MTAWRTRFAVLVLTILPSGFLFVDDLESADSGETLCNGIVLSAPWPPRLSDFPTSVEKDPVVPPYLISPPAVIPIDVGRQLFVDDLSSVSNQPVRFRIYLKNGKLYAFWVSPETSGASHGYVAAGGPGFSSNRDTGSSSSRD